MLKRGEWADCWSEYTLCIIIIIIIQRAIRPSHWNRFYCQNWGHCVTLWALLLGPCERCLYWGVLQSCLLWFASTEENFYEKSAVDDCSLLRICRSSINLSSRNRLKIHFTISLVNGWSCEDSCVTFNFRLLFTVLSFPHGKQFLKHRKFHRSFKNIMLTSGIQTALLVTPVAFRPWEVMLKMNIRFRREEVIHVTCLHFQRLFWGRRWNHGLGGL